MIKNEIRSTPVSISYLSADLGDSEIIYGSSLTYSGIFTAIELSSLKIFDLLLIRKLRIVIFLPLCLSKFEFKHAFDDIRLGSFSVCCSSNSFWLIGDRVEPINVGFEISFSAKLYSKESYSVKSNFDDLLISMAISFFWT